MKYVSVAVVFSLLCSPLLAEEVKPVAVLNQGDIVELSRILDEQVPPRWAKPVVDFINKLVSKQQSEKALGAKPDEQAH